MAAGPVNPLSRASTTQYGLVKLAGHGKEDKGTVITADDPRIKAIGELQEAVEDLEGGGGGGGGPSVPLAHATTHKSAGTDPIRLDELKDPTNNTNTDASSVRHGLMSRLDKIKLDSIIVPSFVYPQPIPLVAGVTLGSNTFIHIQAGGTAIKADAVLGRPAHGFTRVSVGSGVAFEAYQIGRMTGMVLVAGTTYWLGVNGQITSTPPTSPSVINQLLGTASSNTELALSIESPIEILP